MGIQDNRQSVYLRLCHSGWGCSATLFWHLFFAFCAGKLSDVMYVPPWRIATGGNKGKSPLDRFTYKVFGDAD